MNDRLIYLFLFCILIITSCDVENASYPKLYTFSNLDQSDEGLFVLDSEESATAIDLNTGTYGENRDYVKNESSEFIKAIFDLKEIELISENSVRIHFISEEVEIDTVVTYTKDQETILIEGLGSTDIIYHDSEHDQFVLCGFSLIGLPGPNTLNPGQDYNILLIEDCQKMSSINNLLTYVLEQRPYQALDTVGLLVSKFIYQ